MTASQPTTANDNAQVALARPRSGGSEPVLIAGAGIGGLAAAIALARRGLYQEEVNGIYGPAMELSLRAYQARTKLPVTGRLDLETLAALRLLPQPREPFYDPSRRRWRPPHGPPVHGEWVPE